MDWAVTKDQFLNSDEIHKLYHAIKDAKDLAIQRKVNVVHVRDYFILRTLLETGLRVSELVKLNVSDYRSRSLIVRNGKGGKKRTVLLARSTQQMLKEFIAIKRKVLFEPVDADSPMFLSERQRAYTTRGIRKRVKKWFAVVGVSTHLSCHSCRHSYVSHLIAAGVDLPTVRNNAGHSSLAITSIYSHVVKDDLGDIEIYSSAFKQKRNYSKNEERKTE